MHLSPDEMIFWQHGFIKINSTIVFTWVLMLVLAVGSKFVTRNLTLDLKRSRWQNLLEIIVTGIEKQIGDVGLRHGNRPPLCRFGSAAVAKFHRPNCHSCRTSLELSRDPKCSL